MSGQSISEDVVLFSALLGDNRFYRGGELLAVSHRTCPNQGHEKIATRHLGPLAASVVAGRASPLPPRRRARHRPRQSRHAGFPSLPTPRCASPPAVPEPAPPGRAGPPPTTATPPPRPPGFHHVPRRRGEAAYPCQAMRPSFIASSVKTRPWPGVSGARTMPFWTHGGSMNRSCISPISSRISPFGIEAMSWIISSG